MKKQNLKCSHCILGSSYSAMIASYILSQQGIKSVLIDFSNSPSIYEIEIANNFVSPIPIFPVRDSTLYQKLKLSDFKPESIVNIEYSKVKNFSIDGLNYSHNSLAEFLSKNPELYKWIPISLKRWGDKILIDSFSEVKHKITKHYLVGKRSERVGFLDAHSIYYHFLKGHCPELITANNISEIDFKKKVINAENFSLNYERLISTIPIYRLFEKCKIPFETKLKFEGSFFKYFSHSSNWKQNNLIYDCDLSTDIIRIFSPTDNLIAVQLPTFSREKITLPNLKKQIENLVPELKQIQFEKEIFLPMSYPLESITNPNDLKYLETLKSHSIIPFGRFGNWEYSDLHELNWESII